MKLEKIKVNSTYGYKEVIDKPSAQELSEFYTNLYFQKNKSGTYLKKYSDTEKAYFNFQLKLKHELFLQDYSLREEVSMLDVGCGQGWALHYFHNQGYRVTGIDFTTSAVAHHHPSVLPFVKEGDLEQNLQNLSTEQFDFILADNIFEHSTNPENLLAQIEPLLKKGGKLIIEVPNDYSHFQGYLKEKKKTNRSYWYTPPQHLIYFSPQSLQKLLTQNGWEVATMVGSFPIELFLLNGYSNYILQEERGKEAHLSRMAFDLFLSQHADIDDVIQFYKSALKVGIARQIIGVAIKS